MRNVELKHITIRPRNPFAGWQVGVHRLLAVLFLLAFLLELANLCLPLTGKSPKSWPDALLLLLTTATTLASLSRQLPAQNVVLASFVIGMVAGGAHALSVVTAVPFGPVVYHTKSVGSYLFYPLPWSIPLIWIVLILTARGVSKMILRPVRRVRSYGLWVIGLTVALVILLDLGLEPYATRARGYWAWNATKIPWDWYGTPWVNFLGCGVTSLVLLLFVTPALINKSPVPSPPANHPLLVWVALSILCLAGTALQHLRAVSALLLVQILVVSTASLLGARKPKPPA